ncbi:uncharacterized protein LOC119677333 [Teleopsis dalmanni]|uniref:uncharacterized protein LOC119677333 n=1 Tax=Teleopsis dalmanni TaxID=139649 RepID=UPI0018CE2919|nr:uncharacterized protein LOC119677333 [Teleopsis dalmanni]
MDQQQLILKRLNTIFNNLLQPNFIITNNVCFEKLLIHLGAKENEYVLQAPFAMEWVDKCITMMSEDFTKVDPKVISFMLNVCSLLTSNEWVVIEIKEKRIFERVTFLIERDMDKLTSSIKLGIIRLFASVARYSLGLGYIRSEGVWRLLFNYCNRDHTVYVVREAQQFLYEVLYKLSVKTNDEQIVLEILNEVLKPIHDNLYEEQNGKILINVDDSELIDKLSFTLKLISYILQQTIISEEKTNIAFLLEKHHNFEITIWKLCEMSQKEPFMLNILTTLTSFNFAMLVYEKWDGKSQIAPEGFNKFGITFFNMMKFCIARHESLNFIKLAELNHVLWKKLGSRAPIDIEIEDKRIRFENQLIIFHLMPLLFLLRSKEFHKLEIFEQYLNKIFDCLCEHTLRIGYGYRDVLLKKEEESGSVEASAELSYKSIHGILSIGNILERDQAVIVFQGMMYALKEFIINSNPACFAQDQKQTGAELIVKIPKVLYAVLIGLQSLIKKFRITWKESIETICLVNFLAYLLETPNMTTLLSVQALKLLQLGIEHFLSPNMALLVDNLQGSGLVCLGPIILKRFHDIDWEVRDSTLELTTSIVSISRLKFPAFQKFLAESNICPIVYQMAKNDGQPYVRASAFKCLAFMVPINILWEKELCKLDIIEHILYVICNDQEGIVRKEAVFTLSKIYEHRKIPTQHIDVLYSAFAHCVVSDLYWEVQINALQFWEMEIEKQLTNQGMIDGTFPPVTFSKENKKIVQLTEKEITLRIKKVFNELSQRGCLGVILKCLLEYNDIEVTRTAVGIVNRLLEKLQKYNYESIIDGIEIQESSTNKPQTQTNSDVPTPTVQHEQTLLDSSYTSNRAAEIIEDIILEQDVKILTMAYANTMLTNGENEEIRNINKTLYKEYSDVDAKKFLSTIKSLQLNEMLQSREGWLKSTDSFLSELDDIIFATDPGKLTNFPDCY